MDEDLSNWSDEHKGDYRCIVGSFVCVKNNIIMDLMLEAAFSTYP
jgi:hypothetical protein